MNPYSRISFKKKKKRKKIKKLIVWSSSLIVFASLLFYFSLPIRMWLAGSLLITQHSHWAKYTLIGEENLEKLKKEMASTEIVKSETLSFSQNYSSLKSGFSIESAMEEKMELRKKMEQSKPLIEVILVEKHISPVHYFKGHLMKLRDPNRLHLVQTIGKTNKGKPRGEWLIEFSERTHAIGGVNASGFYDPNWMGYARYATGLVIVDGKIIQDYNSHGSDAALGITYDGKLITGNYSSQELIKMGIRDAVSFRPQLVVNGKNLFTGKDPVSWGIAPRTAIGQTKDGTLLLLVIDGRQIGHSLGASMKDLADLMEEYGAINAMQMDGGTSAMMVYKGEILTKSSISDPKGRWIPNAWMIY